MKRLWISLAILLALFGGCLWNIHHVAQISSRLVTTLNQAESLAESGDWSQAQQLTRRAQQQWDNVSHYFYVTQCHCNADEINSGFREVLELLEWEASPEYSAANGVLIAEVEHLFEMENLTLENLL